jgi:thymidylate synthase
MTDNNYRTLLHKILTSGITIRPRGMEVKEISDAQFVTDPYSPFLIYDVRDYDTGYFKKEMRWKLGANRYDTSIQQHAKLWADVINPDGTYNSNYGQYWFGDQGGIWSVVMELLRDPDSRRAVIPMLNASHMSPHVRDTVCTECVGFQIRTEEFGNNPTLNMIVHMRSSDVIYGLGTDVPTFSFLYRLVHGLLTFNLDELIAIGTIKFTCMSSHLYAKHYELAEKIVDGKYLQHDMPFCTGSQAMRIIASRGRQELLDQIDGLGRWLCD